MQPIPTRLAEVAASAKRWRGAHDTTLLEVSLPWAPPALVVVNGPTLSGNRDGTLLLGLPGNDLDGFLHPSIAFRSRLYACGSPLAPIWGFPPPSHCLPGCYRYEWFGVEGSMQPDNEARRAQGTLRRLYAFLGRRHQQLSSDGVNYYLTSRVMGSP